MAKAKRAYFCRECGFEAPKWLGRCPSCGQWNTFTEEVIAKATTSSKGVAVAAPHTPPQRVSEIERQTHRRLDLRNS
ncbi:MAG: DNA repair protein RadA, partial [Rikenellaceae bacterium]|nr:DNA repair protein RadA [Rikenellaceae bacterium]